MMRHLFGGLSFPNFLWNCLQKILCSSKAVNYVFIKSGARAKMTVFNRLSCVYRYIIYTCPQQGTSDDLIKDREGKEDHLTEKAA